MSIEERTALKSLSERDDIIIQNADKGGKIVLMNCDEYNRKCEEDLSNITFYKKLKENPSE